MAEEEKQCKHYPQLLLFVRYEEGDNNAANGILEK